MPLKKPWLCVLEHDYDMDLDHIDLVLHVNEEEGEAHLDNSTKVHLHRILVSVPQKDYLVSVPQILVMIIVK